MKGFISVHRKLMNNAVWTDPNYLKLWIYCLFEASHQDHEQIIGNQKVEIKRGEFPTGRFVLSDAMNKGVKPKHRLTDRTWWRHLENLEKWGMLTIKTTNKFSVVTIVNYDVYQYKKKENDQQIDQQLSNKRPTDATNNNGNNDNNGNKKDYTSKIKDLLPVFSSIPDFNKLNKQYWDVIRETRKNGKVAKSVIYKTMKKWEKYDPVVIEYALKSHIDLHAGKKEEYTIGIMRNTSKEEAIDRMSQKNVIPFSKKAVGGIDWDSV
ncbi:MAG TPA: hypothetical protein VLA13_08890 [Massilibacterium sp.]|nr:hypothetical protein [Massilibacterium sp.]